MVRAAQLPFARGCGSGQQDGRHKTSHGYFTDENRSLLWGAVGFILMGTTMVVTRISLDVTLATRAQTSLRSLILNWKVFDTLLSRT